MPVRKIPKNYLLVTGVFSSRKNNRSLGYESLLERDLMILLEFDDNVERFEEQPVKIPFEVSGKARKPYVPDILIQYKSALPGVAGRKVLGEVKESGDLKKNKFKYAPKFEAAKSYAAEHGWEWRIFKENYIRTALLDNLKFLREYHEIEPLESQKREIIEFIRKTRNKTTVSSLLNKLGQNEDRILLVAPVLWHLVATKVICANLQKPLSQTTKLSLSE